MKYDFPIRTAKERGSNWFVLDLRKIGQGRKYFATEAEAVTERDKKTAELKKYGQLADALPTNVRLECILARDQLAAVGATLRDAVEFFLKHNNGLKSVLLPEAVSLCLEGKQAAGLRPRYIKALKCSLGLFARSHATKNVHDISRDDIRDWLTNNDWSMRTRAGRQIDINTFFSFAVAEGWTKINPTEKLQKISPEDKPIGILTVEQAGALLNAAQTDVPGVLAYVTLGLFCGIRPEEQARLTWDDVDLDAGYVRVESAASKTRNRRLVQISDNAKAWLKLAKELSSEIPPKNWLQRLTVAREKAGITEWPHDALRHSFCSYALPIRGGIQTSNDAGNSETILFKHYRELVKKEDAEKFWAIYPKG